MQSNPLFPEVVSCYKSRYASGIRESLSSYCRLRHVSYKSVTQWMRRHGLDVSSLRLEALLEQNALPTRIEGDQNVFFPRQALDDFLSGKSVKALQGKEPDTSGVDLLRGVSLTFPDGVIVTIRSCTPQALEKLLSKYELTTAAICLP